MRQRDRVKFEKADEYFHFQRREFFAFPIGQSFRGTLKATNEQKILDFTAKPSKSWPSENPDRSTNLRPSNGRRGG